MPFILPTIRFRVQLVFIERFAVIVLNDNHRENGLLSRHDATLLIDDGCKVSNFVQQI